MKRDSSSPGPSIGPTGTLDRYFDRIEMLTLRGAEARAERAVTEMRALGLSERVRVRIGIRGDELPHPAWWRAGNGAWGCLKSHIRILEDAWNDGIERLLIVEDDVCWQADAARRIPALMEQAGDGWGQLYLGGQHQMEPQPLAEKPLLFRGVSINRTHAFAVSRKTIPRLLQHIQHAPDYITSSFPRHIDHQLEIAHQRQDWVVLCPRRWLAGQDENHSQINGRHHPRKWWHWIQHAEAAGMPLVIADRDPDDAERKLLHFGWTLEKDGLTDRGIAKHRKRPEKAVGVLKTIGTEAYGMERALAVKPLDADHQALLASAWKGGVFLLSESAADLGLLTRWRPARSAMIGMRKRGEADRRVFQGGECLTCKGNG